MKTQRKMQENMKDIRSSKRLLYGFVCLLALGFMGYGIGYSSGDKPSAAEPAKTAQSAQPVTNCFESMENLTAVDRKDVQAGMPNVKCSQKTGGVLWYGDPYDSTIAMGEMPDVKDKTRGDYSFEDAVVKPREPKLANFECKNCHDGKNVPVPKDKKPRQIGMHQDIVENSMQMMHGRGAIWCLDCHSAANRNKLVSFKGDEISFNQPQKLCGQCHGDTYADWRMGIHGKRIGTWTKGGKKRWWTCTECHNPHTVQANRFNALKPEPAPALPYGMKDASHESAHGGHDSHNEAATEKASAPKGH